MKLDNRGINLIKSFEGCKLEAYKCSANVWTIGYGHTGVGVYKGSKITQAQADEYFIKDISKFEQGVEKLVKVPLTQGEFNALVSFAYNCGLGALQSSTLLRLLNQKKYSLAAEQFLRWNKVNGKEVAGLTRRRNAEKAMFISHH